MVPRLKAAGADVVIVSCHSGDNGKSSWGDALPYVENASALLAEQVPGIDAILVGHAHLEIPQRYVTNTADRQAGAALRAATTGACASPACRSTCRRSAGSGRSCTPRRPSTTPTSRPRTPRSPRAVAAAHQKVAHLRQRRHRHVHARPCRRRRRATRTPPRSTSSTTSRPTRSRRPSRARPRRRSRCCRSPRRSTSSPRSRPAT